jgi:hypothetical protein
VQYDEGFEDFEEGAGRRASLSLGEDDEEGQGREGALSVFQCVGRIIRIVQ